MTENCLSLFPGDFQFHSLLQSTCNTLYKSRPIVLSFQAQFLACVLLGASRRQFTVFKPQRRRREPQLSNKEISSLNSQNRFLIRSPPADFHLCPLRNLCNQGNTLRHRPVSPKKSPHCPISQAAELMRFPAFYTLQRSRCLLLSPMVLRCPRSMAR